MERGFVSWPFAAMDAKVQPTLIDAVQTVRQLTVSQECTQDMDDLLPFMSPDPTANTATAAAAKASVGADHAYEEEFVVIEEDHDLDIVSEIDDSEMEDQDEVLLSQIADWANKRGTLEAEIQLLKQQLVAAEAALKRANANETSHVSLTEPSGPSSYHRPSQILPNLYLGTKLHATARLVGELKITHVLNVNDKATYRQTPYQFKHIPLDDYGKEILIGGKKLQDCVAFINAARAQPDGVILVHCRSGINRSVTVVMAYLMMVGSYTLKSAYTHIKSRRPQMNPHEKYFEQLQKFDQKLHGVVSLSRADVGPSLQQTLRDIRDEEAKKSQSSAHVPTADQTEPPVARRGQTVAALEHLSSPL